MSTSDVDDEHTGDVTAPPPPGALRVGAVASLAAGAIHATAAGAHSDPRAAAVAFAVVGALQIGWGALALVRGGRLVSAAGVAVNAAALGGWVLAKTAGIGFVDGLDTKESVQFADAAAAGLAAVAVVGALASLLPRLERVARPHPALVGVAAVAALGLGLPAMVATGDHSHAGAGHDEAGGGHHGGDEHSADGHGGDEHGGDHVAMQAAEPYDATLPVDLGGVDGVSPEQQTEAERVVTDTLEVLPQFADWTTLEARGWHSIGDGVTGYEHFMNWPLIEDGKVLDPTAPESLVFKVDGDRKTLVAAMYMTSRDVALEDAPQFAGALAQWHIHDNLCYGGEENKWRVGGVVEPPEPCPPGLFRHEPPAPMVHVWITPHECGPFAALEGVAGGKIEEGEEVNCDHEHGAPA